MVAVTKVEKARGILTQTALGISEKERTRAGVLN